MFRTLCFVAALCLGQGAAAQDGSRSGMPEAAEPAAREMVARVWEVLDFEALMPILRDEAMAEADTMQSSLPGGGTGDGWLAAVATIHDADHLGSLFRAGLLRRLSDHPDPRLDAALAFYESELGQRLVRLETTARRAMLLPDADETARAAFAEAASRGDPRVEQIGRLIDEADLVGPNVAGGMNATVAFSRGFADGGGFDMQMSEAEVLADAWAQEPELHSETLGWMEAYLMLAYAPLSDAELERYIGFAGSPAGQALAALLFAGFDRLFRQTSYDLGLAAARQMQGRDL